MEAPVVIASGLDGLFAREAHLGLDPSARTEMVRSNTKKVFVALTRACRKLLICHRSDRTREIILAQAAVVPQSA